MANPRSKVLFIFNTVLCLGLNILVEKYNLNPKYRFIGTAVLVLNELRAAWLMYQTGSYEVFIMLCRYIKAIC